MIAKTPPPPYYAAIFTSIRTAGDLGYEHMANRMFELATQQPGFLGVESARDEMGITVSYWSSLQAIVDWKNNYEHLHAQEQGKSTWYKCYSVRICLVEKAYTL